MPSSSLLTEGFGVAFFATSLGWVLENFNTRKKYLKIHFLLFWISKKKFLI